MTTGHRLFCKEFLRLNTMPCRHTPLLVHFEVPVTRESLPWPPSHRQSSRGADVRPNSVEFPRGIFLAAAPHYRTRTLSKRLPKAEALASLFQTGLAVLRSSNIYIYICMYIYTYTHYIYIYIHTCIQYICVYIYIHIYRDIDIARFTNKQRFQLLPSLFLTERRHTSQETRLKQNEQTNTMNRWINNIPTTNKHKQTILRRRVSRRPRRWLAGAPRLRRSLAARTREGERERERDR